jgi:hypothetical protein
MEPSPTVFPTAIMVVAATRASPESAQEATTIPQHRPFAVRGRSSKGWRLSPPAFANRPLVIDNPGA